MAIIALGRAGICILLLSVCGTGSVLTARDHISQFHAEASRKIIYAGDSFNVTCWSETVDALTALCGSRDNIYMQAQSKNLSIAIYNDTGIYHEVTNALPKHMNDYAYSCMCRGGLLKSARFMVGVRDLVQDFRCTFRDELESPPLNCTFTMPTQMHAVNPSTKYFLRNHHNESFDCLPLGKDKLRMLCRIPGEHFSKWRSEHKLTLSMNDSMTVQEQSFALSRAECILLERPGTNKTVVNITSDSICLHWENKGKTNHVTDKIEWSIELKPDANGSQWISKSTHNDVLNDTFCLMGLAQPYQEYELNARRRIANPKALWSEPLTHKFTTMPEIPRRPPIVWHNAFQFNDTGELNVYWQQLPQYDRNGPQFTYNISVRYIGATAQITNLDIRVEPNMATIRNLDSLADNLYEVIIRSQNTLGVSKNSSRLIVGDLAGWNERIPRNLRIDKASRTIRWLQPIQAVDLVGYTIFWCVTNITERGSCNTSHAIESEVLLGSRLDFYTEKAKDDKYEWAVSANYVDSTRSGGMLWRKWISYDMPITSTSDLLLHTIEGLAALIVLAIFFYFGFRQYRQMADIKVDLPHGILLNLNNLDQCLPSESKTADQQLPVVISANIRPIEMAPNPHKEALYASYTMGPGMLKISTPTSGRQCDYIAMQPCNKETVPILSDYVAPMTNYRQF